MADTPNSPEANGSEREKAFLRYEEKGGYHWALNSNHLLRGNAFVRARYANALELAERGGGTGGLGGKLVLDHGCGDGVLTAMLARRGARVLGLDNSEIALRYALQRTGGQRTAGQRTGGLDTHYQAGGVYDLPYRSEAFDCVVSTQVIEHIAEPGRLLGEIRRVLKTGGRAVITTRIRLTEKPIDPTHVHEWFEEEFRKVIAEVFPRAEYFRSHPASWMETSYRFKWVKVLANLLSVVRNPYAGFDSGYRLHVIQYALATK
jgi:2-polyprenyl-3-methyl-5-hydroxy-6-metoxy-1,4-benzoquinol methylase